MAAHGNLPIQQTAHTEFRSQRCTHIRAAPDSPSTCKSRAAQAAAFLKTGSRPPALCQRKHQRDGSRTHLTNVMAFFQQASLPFQPTAYLGGRALPVLPEEPLLSSHGHKLTAETGCRHALPDQMDLKGVPGLRYQ